jgi:hypothetical protein
MALYFFGLNDDPPPQHQLAEELASDDEAQGIAEVIAEELGRNAMSRPRIGVFNEAGNRISEARYAGGR